jgi:uncharacterized protein (TIGR03437 family)
LRFFLLLLALPLRAQFAINIVAGGVIPSGIPAQDALLPLISGVTWDASGNLVFCDATYDVIRRVRTDGIIETIVGTGIPGFAGDGGAALRSQLDQPRYPRYDSAGNLYFWDEQNRRIRRVDPKGILTTMAGNGLSFASGQDLTGPATALSLDYIYDLAVDGAGNIYFAESGNRVRRITPAGNVDVLAAGLNSPASVAAESSGNIFILEGEEQPEILRVSSTGAVTTFVNLASPKGLPIMVGNLGIDAAGNLYAVVNGSLVRFARDGSMTTLVTQSNGTSPTVPELNPFGLSVDSQGNIGFVGFLPNIPYSGTTILGEFTTQGQYKILAGATPQPAPDGTPLLNSWFMDASWIAFDHNGNLYIAETAACRIRKIDTSGVLSTFAGTGKCGYPAPSGNAKTADLVLPISIAVDSQDRIWVADDYLNLYSIAQDGTISFYPGRTPVAGGKGQLAIDSKDRVYILGSDSLYRLLPDGTLQAVIAPPTSAGVPPPGSGPYGLSGIGSDLSGNVFFTDVNSVYRVNDDGSFVTIYKNAAITGPFVVDAAGIAWSGDCFTGPQGTSCLEGLGGGTAGASLAGQSALAPDGSSLYIAVSNGIVKLKFPSTPTPNPVIATGGIVNAVSYKGGPIASGELISIFGSNFARGTLQVNAPVNNAIPFALGRTEVLFNGLPGAITAVTPNQINVFVPGDRQTGATIQVTVQVDDAVSLPVPVSVAQAAPGLATSDASGFGPGAILNQDGSVNSQANPARAGSIVSLFGTGMGLTTPDIPSGNLTLSTPYPALQSPVTVAIGGQPAEVLYAGSAPTLPSGVIQINARIPNGVKSGAVPIALTAAGISAMQSVTVWVVS